MQRSAQVRPALPLAIFVLGALAPLACGEGERAVAGAGGGGGEVVEPVAGAGGSGGRGGAPGRPDAAPGAGRLDDAAAPIADGASTDLAGSPDSSPDTAATDAGPPDAGDPVEQLPPQGKRAADAWLAAGHYKKWKCEPMKMNPRPLGVHGPNRVCSNALLSGHVGPGPYPVGAAAVKEIFYGNRVGNYAIAVKIKDGTTGASWYWYEPGDLEGVGAPGCVGCHSRAAQNGGRDFVFIQVR
jgi:hypothetical protein